MLNGGGLAFEQGAGQAAVIQFAAAPVGAARQSGELPRVDWRMGVARERQRHLDLIARNQRVEQRRVEIGALRHGARRVRGVAGCGGHQLVARQGGGLGENDQRRLAAQ